MSYPKPEIEAVERAAIAAQQYTIDRVLDVLENGTPITAGFTIRYRDDKQMERMRALRDRLLPKPSKKRRK